MTFRLPKWLVGLLGVCLVCCLSPGLLAGRARDEQSAGRFPEVLELAGLGQDVLSSFSGERPYPREDWQLVIRLLYRMGQFSTAEQDPWALAFDGPTPPQIGDLCDVVGKVEGVEAIELPAELAADHDLPRLFFCQVRLENAETDAPEPDSPEGVVLVLTPRIPQRWHDRAVTEEPVRFRGVLLQLPAGGEDVLGVLVSAHLAWYPVQGVPAGQQLLARAGMDVALLDEVVQRRPFVRPEVSREGEAFYGCLAALARIDAVRLDELAKRNVSEVAQRWRRSLTDLRGDATAGGAEDSQAVRQQKAIASAVAERSELGFSSVAPLFLQPEREVGELVRLEGTARRAIRIAAEGPQIESYYELEVFTPDSQNLPIVCCVSQLPRGFPQGDVIREPVRVAGIFFKSWRFRTRQVAEGEGETGRPQQLYTPVMIGRMPTWLHRSASRESRWGLWGGIAFLIVLAVVSACLVSQARRDQRRRRSMRPAEIDLGPDATRVESTE